MSELDELCKRVVAHPGVKGFLIFNGQGNAIRTSFDKERTAQFAFHMHTITSKARNCLNDMDSSNELQFIRIRSKCHEIMIAPDKDYAFMVIQS